MNPFHDGGFLVGYIAAGVIFLIAMWLAGR